jgi:NADPH2:quinone reductase
VHSVSLNFGEVAYLVALLSRRQLEPNIGWRGSWEPVDAAARALLDRRVTGKAVLDVRGGEAR